jgi:hypothetical protein
MDFKFPPAPSQYSSRYFTDLIENIRRALLPGISKDTAAPRLLLQSPNGKVYEVKVSDTGVLSTVVNDGNGRP